MNLQIKEIVGSCLRVLKKEKRRASGRNIYFLGWEDFEGFIFFHNTKSPWRT